MGTPLDNDVRGWIMTIASGIACVVGSSIICIDLVLNRIPRWKNFSIQDSSLFLACSMSLSFGVMIFSALYSMLPSSKKYLEKAEMSPAKASWLLLIFFILGFIGIQIISRFLHHYIPSQVVDCDHRHDESAKARKLIAHAHHHPHARHPRSRRHSHGLPRSPPSGVVAKSTESTPLLNGSLRARPAHPPPSDIPPSHPSHPPSDQRTLTDSSRRPSMVQVQNRVMSFVRDNKANCDELGPCFGYSEPCGQECFKQFLAMRSQSHSRPPTLRRVRSLRRHSPVRGAEGEDIESQTTEVRHVSSSCGSVGDAHHDHDLDGACLSDSECCSDDELADDEQDAAHHHHVPENAFLNIGLQTSIAIALHKLPEGFITYATNHASPALGFSVFMALFTHNITEGFAMALPLYLALGSRMKAMCWSSILGGVSQPLGAGIAAVWFKLAGHGVGEDGEAVGGPGFAVYGCMFAVTAGIMTSVALQLFVEGLGMCHRKELCIGCAVLGMALLGMSNALTAQ